mgnify:CR=1 FL=1
MIPFFIQGQTTVTICDGDSALIYGNWQTNSGTYTNSNGNTTTLVVNPLPIITPNFVLNGDATIQPGNVFQLTPAIGNQSGSVWNNIQINLNNPFHFNIDIFLGFGFSRVESTIRYGIRANPAIEDYAPVTKTEVSGSTGTMPFRRMGIASGGDSFGFMLEFLFPGKREVIDNPFYADTIIDSTIYNATYNNQGESLPTKVGIPGGITRLSWTYSF